MKTLKKAKEIFSSQINQSPIEKPFYVTEQKTALHKNYSTSRLYKLYLYNKTLQKELKKLNLLNLYKVSKLKNNFYKVFVETNKITTSIKKQRFILKINKILKKYTSTRTIKFSFFRNSLIKVNYSKKLKNILINLNFLIFSNFFEYKISYLFKTKKKLGSLKNQLKLFLADLKTSKKVINLQLVLKNFILKFRGSLKNLFINFHLSNKLINDLIKRVQLVVCVYFLAFFVLFSDIFMCLLNNQSLKKKIIPVFLLDNKFFSSFLINIKTYSSIASIFYLSLFLKPKNTLILPKNSISHIGLCAVTALLSFGIEMSQTLINYLVKSIVLFTDIYFCRFFIKTDKKLRFLRSFTNLVTSETNLTFYYWSKRFQPTILFNLDMQSVISNPIRYNCFPGRYEHLIEKILYDAGVPRLETSGKFVKNYLHLPFYSILLISLVYNCCYYIIYNKQPYIPVVTNLVKKLTPNNQSD